MEILIMKCLFVLIGVIPVTKRLDIFKKKVKFTFTEEKEVSQEDMQLLKDVIERTDKK